MTHLPPFPSVPDAAAIEVALLPKGTCFFSELMELLEADEGLLPTRRRDMKSSLRRVAKALDRPLERVPANTRWLQPRLHDVSPAAQGLSRKTWSNALSDLRGAMVHLGIVDRAKRCVEDLSPEWKALWQKVLAAQDLTLRTSLPRFVHFLDRLEVPPTDVDETHAEAFREALAEFEIRRSPQAAADNAVIAWNAAVVRIKGWPARKLEREVRRKRVTQPVEVYPESFGAHLERWLASQMSSDPLAEPRPRRALSPATIAQYRCELLRFAARVVLSGSPREQIIDLHALLRHDNVHGGTLDVPIATRLPVQTMVRRPG
ncbi:MAG: hypothetical protein AAF368_19455, partial [Planctomycetota bacterium]